MYRQPADTLRPECDPRPTVAAGPYSRVTTDLRSGQRFLIDRVAPASESQAVHGRQASGVLDQPAVNFQDLVLATEKHGGPALGQCPKGSGVFMKKSGGSALGIAGREMTHAMAAV